MGCVKCCSVVQRPATVRGSPNSFFPFFISTRRLVAGVHMVKTYSLLFFLSCLLVIALGSQSLAQGRKPGDPSGPKPGQNNPSSTEQDDADAAAGATGCAGCGACGVFGVVVMVVVPIVTALVTLILNIVLMIWVNKDAKARGMENGVIWMCLIFFT